MSTPMIAMTAKSSTSVNAKRERGERRPLVVRGWGDMADVDLGKNEWLETGNRAALSDAQTPALSGGS